MADTGASDDGLASLIAIHRSELLAFLLARCGDRGEAEELLHELWLKVGKTPAGPVGDE